MNRIILTLILTILFLFNGLQSVLASSIQPSVWWGEVYRDTNNEHRYCRIHSDGVTYPFAVDPVDFKYGGADIARTVASGSDSSRYANTFYVGNPIIFKHKVTNIILPPWTRWADDWYWFNLFYITHSNNRQDYDLADPNRILSENTLKNFTIGQSYGNQSSKYRYPSSGTVHNRLSNYNESYTWEGDNISWTPDKAGYYQFDFSSDTARTINEGNCNSIGSTGISGQAISAFTAGFIYVNPTAVTVPACTPNTQNINSGGSATFSTSGASGGFGWGGYSYSWADSDGNNLGTSTSVSKTYTNNTSNNVTKTITVTAKNGDTTYFRQGTGQCSVTVQPAPAAPVVTGASIPPTPVSPDGTTQYTITTTATDSNSGGGSNINTEFALINFNGGTNQGPNAGTFRGYIGWTNTSPLTYFTWGSTHTTPIACTGGGSAAKYNGYGHQYINLISCTTSVSGNTRTVTFTVSFNTNFLSPVFVTSKTGLGNAVSFNGTSDSISAPDSSSLRITSYSVSAWIKPAVAENFWTGIVGKPGRNFNMWFGQSNSSSGFIHHRFHDSSPNTNNGCPDSGAVPIDGNTWTHVVITNDGTTCRTYLNGVQSVSGAVTGPLIVNNTVLQIGKNLDGAASNYYKGLIDEIGIWNRVLSATEISALYGTSGNGLAYNASTSPFDSGVAAYYKLDETTGTPTVTDVKNGNTGTITGTVNNNRISGYTQNIFNGRDGWRGFGTFSLSTPTPTPTPTPVLEPWIQTTGGDVHSNTSINTPGGP